MKWVYKTKFNEKGKVERHKARLLAKGFAQQPGVDYGETFAPIARLDTVRVVLTIVAQKCWLVYQMDAKLAIFNAIQEEAVFVSQPLGFEFKGLEIKLNLSTPLFSF